MDDMCKTPPWRIGDPTGFARGEALAKLAPSTSYSYQTDRSTSRVAVRVLVLGRHAACSFGAREPRPVSLRFLRPMKLHACCAFAAALVAIGCAAPTAHDATRAERGSPSRLSELPGLELRAGSRWAALEPLESTMADVRRVMGPPNEERDLARYSANYPGDDVALQPLYRYSLDPEWDALVYFVKTSSERRARFPASLQDRLFSIDLIPREERSFDIRRIPTSFIRTHVDAADGAWDEFADGSGLVYAIASRDPPKLRIVDRVSYGPSDAALRRHFISPVTP